MKKFLLISLTISTPILSMLRAQRVGTILLRNSTAITRRMATSQFPKEPFHDLDVQDLTDCLDPLEIHAAKQKKIKNFCGIRCWRNTNRYWASSNWYSHNNDRVPWICTHHRQE